LSMEEMQKLCAWIDLGVPFCGDYVEANCWSEKQKAFYLRYQNKRNRLALEEEENIKAYVRRDAAAGTQ